MTKCFQCVKDEHNKKISWNEVMDAVVMFKGTGYCFEHLTKELNWEGTSLNQSENQVKNE